jgi:hypothetical protein
MVSFMERDKRDQDVFFIYSSLYKSFRDHATYEKIWMWTKGQKKIFVFAFSQKLLARLYGQDKNFRENLGKNFR